MQCCVLSSPIACRSDLHVRSCPCSDLPEEVNSCQDVQRGGNKEPGRVLHPLPQPRELGEPGDRGGNELGSCGGALQEGQQ